MGWLMQGPRDRDFGSPECLESGSQWKAGLLHQRAVMGSHCFWGGQETRKRVPWMSSLQECEARCLVA